MSNQENGISKDERKIQSVSTSGKITGAFSRVLCRRDWRVDWTSAGDDFTESFRRGLHDGDGDASDGWSLRFRPAG